MKTEIQKEFANLNKKASAIEKKIENIISGLASGDVEKLFNELETVKCKLQSTRFVGQKNTGAVDCEISVPRFIRSAL